MSPRLTRLELALVVAIFVIGFGLRAAYPSRMAVEHFDEGVYASNLYTPEGRFPFQHLYAPPLLPFCLEMAAIIGGPHAVMWVNVVSGSLTLLVLWGMVREWWGPPAAMAAMVLLAFNEFHIAYSRAALTDAMLGLWMTAGVWAGWRAIQFGGLGNVVAAGVLASLAWWTKYNGWLTLAITGSGTAGWILFGGARSSIQASGGRQPPVDRPGSTTSASRRKIRSPASPPLAEAPKTDTVFGAARLYLGRWALTAGIAFLLWSPWLWELQQYGGYAAVAKNHAGYFTGLGQWWAIAVRQYYALAHYLAWFSCLGVVVAGYTQSALHPTSRQPDWDREISFRGSLGRFLTHSGTWLIAAWSIGLTIAIPLYTPYPRLMIPWVIAVPTLMIGGMVKAGELAATREDIERPVATSTRGRSSSTWIFIAAGVVIAASVFWRGFSKDGPGVPWSDRTSLASTSRRILDRIGSQSHDRNGDGLSCVVSVVAEPGLYFQLSAAQRASAIGHMTLPAGDFSIAQPGSNTSGLPVYVVTGPHAEQSEAERLIAEGRLELVAEFEYRPSDLVLLDSRPAWDLPPKDKPAVERIRLLHVKLD